MSRWIFPFGGLVLGILIWGVMKNQEPSEKKSIRVAFGSPWKTLHPGEQHTLVGDLVLSNQFEALIGLNDQGRIIPLGAKSWTVNEDFTKYEFTIDINKQFSDGSHLSASDYKKSWEESLKLEPKSNNSSLLDVMYKIKGYEALKSSGQISGIEVVGHDRLIIHFASPFRMALDHLVGNRFAAFKQVGENQYIGTGKYIVSESGENQIEFEPSPVASEKELLDPLSGTFIHSRDAVSSLMSDKLDVFGYARGADIPEELDEKLEILIGQDALHESIYINRNKGHIFQDKKLRQAFQFLMHKVIRENKSYIGNPKYWTQEEQLYLPLQPGHIEREESQQLVNQGERYVDDLRAASKENPVRLCTFKGKDWVKKTLDEYGIAVSKNSKIVDFKDSFQEVYKKMECDVTPFIFSVALGDPDGIYHALGKSGAILSPMIYSHVVGDLLEEGRKIVDREKLDSFYQKVTRAALEDVPMVHIGFSKAVAIYRKDKIEVFDKDLRRNEGHLHMYRWK